METAPTVDQAADCFNAYTVEPVDAFPFAETVQAARPYADGEMDGLL